MNSTAAWGYEMLRKYGRNRERYEVIRPQDYQEKKEEAENDRFKK